MKEYITPEVGKVIKSEDYEALAKALIDVLDNLKQYKREELSKYVEENFAQEKSIARLIEIYNEAMKEGSL